MKTFYSVVDRFCSLVYKGSACFDRPNYWISVICIAKLWKTAFCPNYVSLLQKHRLIVLFTSDVMYKKYKRLLYTPPLRFVGKTLWRKLVEHRKIGLIWYFGLPFWQRNATYKLQRVNWLPSRTLVSYNRPLWHLIKFLRCPINLMN